MQGARWPLGFHTPRKRGSTPRPATLNNEGETMFYLALLSLILGAEAKIDAPDKAPTSQFILIDGVGATGKLTWAVPDREVSVFTAADSKQIVIYCPPPSRLVTIKQHAVDSAGKSTDTVVIDFRQDYKPDPAKPDEVKPNKTLPAGRFGITQKCFQKASEVESTDRKGDAAKLIAALEALQNEFRTDQINPSTPQQVSGAINRACHGLTADQQKRWLPTFGSWWTVFIRDLWDAGQLATKEDWIQLIEETLIGLKAVL
jgi:hypothetical protein